MRPIAPAPSTRSIPVSNYAPPTGSIHSVRRRGAVVGAVFRPLPTRLSPPP